jgi:hypothetical protein
MTAGAGAGDDSKGWWQGVIDILFSIGYGIKVSECAVYVVYRVVFTLFSKPSPTFSNPSPTFSNLRQPSPTGALRHQGL